MILVSEPVQSTAPHALRTFLLTDTVTHLAPAAALAILSLLPALKLLPPDDPATNLEACCTTSRHRYRVDRLGGHRTRKGNPKRSCHDKFRARKAFT